MTASLLSEELCAHREPFVNASERGKPFVNEWIYPLSRSMRWFPLKNHDGSTWWIELTSHEDNAEMRGPKGSKGLSGLTIPDEKIVLIDAADSRKIQDYITLHEMMHVSLDGVDGISSKEEERVITKMAPNLYPILHRFGLRWPDRPEEIVALERRARRNKK